MHDLWAPQVALVVKNPAANLWDIRNIGMIRGLRSLGGGHANHSSILGWRIPWTEEPGGLQSIRLQRFGYDWSTQEHAWLVSLSHSWYYKILPPTAFYFSFPLQCWLVTMLVTVQKSFSHAHTLCKFFSYHHHTPTVIDIHPAGPSPSPLCIYFELSKILVNLKSVQFSLSVMSNSLQSHGLQHARPPCPSPTPGVYSNACL